MKNLEYNSDLIDLLIQHENYTQKRQIRNLYDDRLRWLKKCEDFEDLKNSTPEEVQFIIDTLAMSVFYDKVISIYEISGKFFNRIKRIQSANSVSTPLVKVGSVSFSGDFSKELVNASKNFSFILSSMGLKTRDISYQSPKVFLKKVRRIYNEQRTIHR